jgi:hypothetical protein
MRFFSAESLDCTGCGESFPFPLGDNFLYTEGDLDLSPENLATSTAFHPLLAVRAWCIDCNRPTLAERIPSTREFMNAVALARIPAGLRQDIDISDDLLDIGADEQRFLFEKLTTRASRPRCLLCGSKDWLRLDVENLMLKPSLIHDTCNSPFKWRGVISGGTYRRVTIRAYSFEGQLLAKG